VNPRRTLRSILNVIGYVLSIRINTELEECRVASLLMRL
jgi:hypothetical protein